MQTPEFQIGIGAVSAGCLNREPCAKVKEKLGSSRLPIDGKSLEQFSFEPGCSDVEPFGGRGIAHCEPVSEREAPSTGVGDQPV